MLLLLRSRCHNFDVKLKAPASIDVMSFFDKFRWCNFLIPVKSRLPIDLISLFPKNKSSISSVIPKKSRGIDLSLLPCRASFVNEGVCRGHLNPERFTSDKNM